MNVGFEIQTRTQVCLTSSGTPAVGAPSHPQPLGQSPAHRDSHHVGAARGILGYPGNVVVGGELGDIVVGVQELDHNIRCGAELLWGVHFNGQELGKGAEEDLSGWRSPAESLPASCLSTGPVPAGLVSSPYSQLPASNSCCQLPGPPGRHYIISPHQPAMPAFLEFL